MSASILALAVAAGCQPAPALPEITANPSAPSPSPAQTAASLQVSAITPPVGSGLDTATPTFAPSPAAPLIPASFQSPPENRTRYMLNARLDYNRHTLAVEEAIDYTNTTAETIAAIPLVVEALRYPHTFQLGEVLDSVGKPVVHRLEDITLTLTLPEPLPPGASTAFTIAYTLTLPDVTRLPNLRPYPLGYTTTQANFGDWYPYIPPYDAEKGWSIHPPAMYGEHLAYDVADFDVAIRLEGSLTSVTVAAGAPVKHEARADGNWLRHRHEAARNFAWSASPYYEVITQTVQTEAGSSVVLASYHYSYQAAAGKSLLAAMAQALPLYSRLFGDYPHTQLTAVQADFLDGMEYDGLFFLSTDFYNWHKGTPEDFLLALGAHETSHQWWMGLVGSNPAEEPWLDEALCTYSEVIYYENVYPDALDWWWTYRVNYYEPQGWIDIGIYDVPGQAGQYRLYRDPVYLRGALFLDELRLAMGDDAFFAGLRAYAARYAYRQADAAGFFEAIREQTDEDLSPVIDKYFQYP